MDGLCEGLVAWGETLRAWGFLCVEWMMSTDG